MKKLILFIMFIFTGLLCAQVTQLTNGSIGTGHLEWSPDGTMLASCSWGVNTSIIWITNTDGSGSRQLNIDPAVGGDFYLSWSPDSKELLFDFRDIDGPLVVARVSYLGGSYEKLTEKGCFMPDWSADGNQFTYMNLNMDIFKRNIDGTNPVNLTNNSADDFHPDWSPLNDKILFTSNRDGNRELYTITTDGQTVERLTHNTSSDDRSCWSPDGRFIAFESDRSGSRQTWIMNADGSNPFQLTTELPETRMPTWSPDGSQIAVTYGTNGDYKIYIVDVNTLEVKQELTPKDFGLQQNYPNPFNPETTLRYTLPLNESGYTRLTVYDLQGREVAVLVNDIQQGGTYSISYNAEELSSGVYVCTLEFNKRRSSTKMLLIK